MPAMHDIVLNYMNTELENKRDIYLRTLPFDMTHEECIRLIAPSDHIHVLTHAAQFAKIRAVEEWVNVTVPAVIDGESLQEVYLSMRTHAEQLPPLVPRDPQWQPGQNGDKVIQWLTKRYEIGRKFGLIKHVLYTLNRDCDDGAQLRYLWPVILHLCKMGRHAKMDRWIEKFSAYKPCKSTPGYTPQFRKIIQETSGFMTALAMIGDDIPEQPAGFVQISEYGMPSFKLDGVTINRM